MRTSAEIIHRCLLPLLLPVTAGQELVCVVTVVNTAIVRLSNVTLSGDGGCSFPGQLLLPQESFSCNMSKAATQDDFQAGQMQIAASAVGVGLGTNSQTSGNATETVDLDVKRTLSLSLALVSDENNTAALVSATGTVVSLSVTASNLGSVHLHNVTLAVTDLALLFCKVVSSNVTVKLPAAIPVGEQLVCTGNYEFSQDALEAGDKMVTATGTATALPEPASSDPVRVKVAAAAALQLDVDANNCTKPAHMREYI